MQQLPQRMRKQGNFSKRSLMGSKTGTQERRISRITGKTTAECTRLPTTSSGRARSLASERFGPKDIMSSLHATEPSKSSPRSARSELQTQRSSSTNRGEMAGVALDTAKKMNALEIVVTELRKLAKEPSIEIIVDEPAVPDGRWFISVVAADGYSVEVEWRRHIGFGVSGGYELGFGTGVDELFATPDATVDRIRNLIEQRTSTSASASVGLAELRRLRGEMQKDVASRLNISKSGLAQIEKASALGAMQIATLKKVIGSLGGELVLTAQFPDGSERTIAVD